MASDAGTNEPDEWFWSSHLRAGIMEVPTTRLCPVGIVIVAAVRNNMENLMKDPKYFRTTFHDELEAVEAKMNHKFTLADKEPGADFYALLFHSSDQLWGRIMEVIAQWKYPVRYRAYINLKGEDGEPTRKKEEGKKDDKEDDDEDDEENDKNDAKEERHLGGTSEANCVSRSGKCTANIGLPKRSRKTRGSLFG
jgi:hypothetical protein